MDICIVMQIYLAMATTHLDTAQNHVKIAEGGKFLVAQCEQHEKKSKVGKSKVEQKIQD